MQLVIEAIRKVVVLVLLMELVLQMQVGKQYESYIKMLVGIMVVYSLVVGVFGAFSDFEEVLKPMEDMQWSGEWLWELERQAEEIVEENLEESPGMEESLGTESNIHVQVQISPVSEIVIDEIAVGEAVGSGP